MNLVVLAASLLLFKRNFPSVEKRTRWRGTEIKLAAGPGQALPVRHERGEDVGGPRGARGRAKSPCRFPWK